MLTPRRVAQRADRKAEVVDMHMRQGLTFRAIGQLLGVSYETARRDFSEYAPEKDAETKQMAGTYRALLAAKHLRIMGALEPIYMRMERHGQPKEETGEPIQIDSDTAGNLMLRHMSQFATLVGANLPEKIEMLHETSDAVAEAAALEDPFTRLSITVHHAEKFHNRLSAVPAQAGA
jgi:hypothetical protein